MAFFNFKGKIVFGDPPLPQTPGKFASKNTPNEGDPKIGPGPYSKCDFLVLKSTVPGGLSFSGFLTKTEPSPQDCKFFKVFQNFSVFFKVFQCFSGFLSLSSDEGPPPRPFHSLILVKGGWYLGKIVFGDPPLPQTPTPP